VYRRIATVLIVSLIVPYGFNLLYNFDVGPFGRIDLTPFLLVGSCLVLVWGLFRFRLLGIRPVARGRRGGPQPGHGRQQALRHLRQLDEQRRSLLERVVTSQEQERRQVAGDIHDDAIQAMVAVSLQLQALGGRLRDPRSTEPLARLAATATESVGRLRQLVFELRPPLLDEVGLAAAIGQYATRAGELAGFVAQVTDESAGELPDELRVVAYRIVQEALANVRAHAKASRVAVRLEEADGGLLVRVSDDGVGFLPGLADRRPAGHLGLISMREQAAMAGGWSRIASAPGMGTTVEVWVPRPKG
jgi:signal transduction histidine kinase